MNKRIVPRVLYGFILGFVISSSVSATPVYEIEIRNHLFFPSELTIPPNTKVKLLIKNSDPSAEEFESYELNREKVILGHSKGVVFIGPLEEGVYPFFGEFFPKTAQGKINVKAE
ncbi:MAG: cupredoxin domain-containing protein [Cycloclasticus sp.]|nr:cupredoxin domain-containing protein [Cycloclasticus sp.]